MVKMKVALVIGHNKRSKGAYSTIIGSEYDYWKRIAEKIKGEIPECVDIYERKSNKAYVPEMNEVLKELNKNDYKFCTKENTVKVKMQEKKIDGKVWEEEKKITTRGLILIQDSKTRGGYGICKSKDTYILVESFFGSNNDESLKFSVEKDIVDLFVNFIKENI